MKSSHSRAQRRFPTAPTTPTRRHAILHPCLLVPLCLGALCRCRFVGPPGRTTGWIEEDATQLTSAPPSRRARALTCDRPQPRLPQPQTWPRPVLLRLSSATALAAVTVLACSRGGPDRSNPRRPVPPLFAPRAGRNGRPHLRLHQAVAPTTTAPTPVPTTSLACIHARPARPRRRRRRARPPRVRHPTLLRSPRGTGCRFTPDRAARQSLVKHRGVAGLLRDVPTGRHGVGAVHLGRGTLGDRRRPLPRGPGCHGPPFDFAGLSPAEQLFVLVDIERVTGAFRPWWDGPAARPGRVQRGGCERGPDTDVGAARGDGDGLGVQLGRGRRPTGLQLRLDVRRRAWFRRHRSQRRQPLLVLGPPRQRARVQRVRGGVIARCPRHGSSPRPPSPRDSPWTTPCCWRSSPEAPRTPTRGRRPSCRRPLSSGEWRGFRARGWRELSIDGGGGRGRGHREVEREVAGEVRARPCACPRRRSPIRRPSTRLHELEPKCPSFPSLSRPCVPSRSTLSQLPLVRRRRRLRPSVSWAGPTPSSTGWGTTPARSTSRRSGWAFSAPPARG